jgi:hypothetical protein
MSRPSPLYPLGNDASILSRIGARRISGMPTGNQLGYRKRYVPQILILDWMRLPEPFEELMCRDPSSERRGIVGFVPKPTRE